MIEQHKKHIIFKGQDIILSFEIYIVLRNVFKVTDFQKLYYIDPIKEIKKDAIKLKHFLNYEDL